ncbi:YbjN domain-containing protein [Amphritea japonica]|nr:YbjN domain-containing protein [Amphritea japonica]
MKALNTLISTILLSFLAISAQADSTIVERFSDTEVKQVLRDEGYGSVRIIEEGEIRFKAAGNIYVLYNHDDGDLHLYFGSTGLKLNYEDMNEWNRTTRLSRAYLDNDMDIALETDLLSNAGITQDMMKAMIQVFVETSVPRYISFAQDNDKN